MRLPFVMTGVNRSVSAPISIQVDQQDSVSLRDSGIIQLYAESSVEAYDLHLMAFRIAEDPGILLPVMVCVDGWILTHNYEPVSLLDPRAVDRFLPPFEPQQFLDVNRPLTYGSYAEDDVLMEMKYSIHDAMIRAKARIKEIMSTPPIVVDRSFALEKAVELMFEHGIKKLPVVERVNDKMKLVGLITLTDIARIQPKLIETLKDLFEMRGKAPPKSMEKVMKYYIV